MSNAKVIGILLIIAGLMMGGVPLITSLAILAILLTIAKLVSGNSGGNGGFFK